MESIPETLKKASHIPSCHSQPLCCFDQFSRHGLLKLPDNRHGSAASVAKIGCRSQKIVWAGKIIFHSSKGQKTKAGQNFIPGIQAWTERGFCFSCAMPFLLPVDPGSPADMDRGLYQKRQNGTPGNRYLNFFPVEELC